MNFKDNSIEKNSQNFKIKKKNNSINNYINSESSYVKVEYLESKISSEKENWNTCNNIESENNSYKKNQESISKELINSKNNKSKSLYSQVIDIPETQNTLKDYLNTAVANIYAQDFHDIKNKSFLYLYIVKHNSEYDLNFYLNYLDYLHEDQHTIW